MGVTVPEDTDFTLAYLVGTEILSPEEARQIARDCLGLNLLKRKKRRAPTDPAILWPDNTIYYGFCSNIDKKVKRLVVKAMKHLADNTCLKFKKKKNDNMLMVSDVTNACAAKRGFQGGLQPLLVGNPGCHNLAGITHLLQTTIGMFNAATRPDRDAYITVNTDNVKPESLVSFRKCTECETFGIPADIAGNMMGVSKSFTKNGKPTSMPLDLRQLKTMGSSYAGPTFYDFLFIKMLYCPDKCEDKPNKCAEGAFLNTNNCRKCTCPEGFAAKNCDRVEPGKPKSCGGKKTATPQWQTINSPRYPFKHPKGQRCSWVIDAPEPFHRIEFEIIGPYFAFYFSPLPLCINYLDVRLQEDLKKAGIMHCGYNVPKNAKYLSEVNKMSVIMRADIEPDKNYFGFKARYRISPVQNDERLPVDCQLTEWEEWSPCTESCGGGQHIRTRSVVEQAQFGGTSCAEFHFDEIEYCNEDPCPIDCEVGPWGGWGDCSATCGGGEQDRSREVTVPDENGGTECPELTETKICNPTACPVDCEVSDWDEWSTCDATCGGGSQERIRTVLVPDDHGGKACSEYEMVEEQECGTDPCPVDCVMSPWSPFDTCTGSCGGGEKSRRRGVVSQAEYGGAECPDDLKETEECGTIPCPIDCDVSRWDNWGECTHSCGGGTRERTRTIEEEDAYGGVSCDTYSLIDIKPCNDFPCPVPCEVSEWSAWDTCSVTCGQGQQRKIRDVLVDAEHGGESCEGYALEEDKTCSPGPCPIDCEVNDWTEWLECSETCGGGRRGRSREVVKPDANGGEGCPDLEEVEDCNTNPCPVDCVLGEWEAFGECSENCGGGEWTRTRPIDTYDDYGGKPCSELQTEDTKPCNTQPCPIDCVVTPWAEWAQCSASCGGGLRNRDREIETPDQYGGEACPEDLYEEGECAENPCPIDCVMNPWDDWGDCTHSCGGGEQERSRTVDVQDEYGGLSCDLFATSETRTCGDRPCPIPCEVSKWSEWGACSVSCGGAEQGRTREIMQQSEFGGDSCDQYSLLETQTCNDNPCPIDCIVSEWSDYSECSITCGGGTQKKVRSIVREEAYGGIVCSQYPLEEEQACSPDPCPIDCEMEDWKPWGECSVSCGGGVSVRSRGIKVRDDYGGVSCDEYPQSQEKPCHPEPCPIDCEVNPWGQWEPCSVTCGGGEKKRYRSVAVEGAFGGTPCSEYPLEESGACGEAPCPVDCVVTSWNPWDYCSKTCGGGEQGRTRTITTEASYGGAECPTLEEMRPCGDRPCPIPCEVSDWSIWGDCTASCGGGTQTRDRDIMQVAQFEGDSCDAYSLEETQTCGKDPCPVDCIVSDWSDWDECTYTCGGGEQFRNREIQREAAYGGEACPEELSEGQECGTTPCPIDCVMGNWTIWTECSTTCGGGIQDRTRPVAVEAQYGGEACPDNTDEEQACNENPCPVDCIVTNWSDWDVCDVICDGGNQQRTREVSSQAMYGGKPCSEFPMNEEQACNEEPCPQCDTISCPENEHCSFKDGLGATCVCDEGFSRRYGVCLEVLCTC